MCRPAFCQGLGMDEGAGAVSSAKTWSELQVTLPFLASGRGAVPHPPPGHGRSVPQPTHPCPWPQPQVKAQVQPPHPFCRNVSTSGPAHVTGNRSTRRRGTQGTTGAGQPGGGGGTYHHPTQSPEKKVKQSPYLTPPLPPVHLQLRERIMTAQLLCTQPSSHASR